MKIGQKIWLSLITILGLLLVIGCYSVWSAITVETSITSIQATNTRAITAAKAENEYTGAVLEIRRYIAEGDEKYSKNFEEKLNSVIALENQLLTLTPANQRSQVEKLISDTEQYRNGVVSRLIPLLREQFSQKLAGNAEKAALAGQQSAAVTRELTPFAQSIQKILHDSVDENSKAASSEVTRVNSDVAGGVKFSIILGLCATVLGLVMSYFLTKQITAPIQVVTEEINTMALGDFTAEENAALSSRRDEFGQVAQSLSQMKTNLKQLLVTIQERSELLSAASEQLQASAEQSALASTQVANSIVEVAGGAQTQSQAVEQTLVQVDQTASDVISAAANAQEATNLCKTAATAADKGGTLVDSAQNQMAHINQTVQSSAQVVGRLGERSVQISEIVDTITELAEQTNLLALNAAIEAARAGEQGRGFAVVADEVRKLAEKSAEAAKHIAQLIREIQSETNQAVTAMNSGTQEAKVGAQVVSEAGAAFHDIAEMIATITAKVTDITQTTNQLSIGSQAIVTAVQSIDSITKATSAETQSVSAATEEQTASMQEIAATSRTLAMMAEELQGDIRKFKV